MLLYMLHNSYHPLTFLTQSLAKIHSFSSFLSPLQGSAGLWFSMFSSSTWDISEYYTKSYIATILFSSKVFHIRHILCAGLHLWSTVCSLINWTLDVVFDVFQELWLSGDEGFALFAMSCQQYDCHHLLSVTRRFSALCRIQTTGNESSSTPWPRVTKLED